MDASQVKHIADLGSAATLLATIAGWLPNIAAVLTIAWTALRIYESKTVQRWLGKEK